VTIAITNARIVTADRCFSGSLSIAGEQIQALDSQPVALACRCEDCKALQAFARDPQLREQRFRVRQDRREHLQRQIAQHALDMHHVTDRTGSPQTLVCRKTRENYRRQCRQHGEDVAAMHALHALRITAPDADLARLAAAVERQPQAVEG